MQQNKLIKPKNIKNGFYSAKALLIWIYYDGKKGGGGRFCIDDSQDLHFTYETASFMFHKQ